ASDGGGSHGKSEGAARAEGSAPDHPPGRGSVPAPGARRAVDWPARHTGLLCAVRVVGTLAVLIAVSGAIAVLGTWPMAAHLHTHVVDPGTDPLAAFWSKLADVHLTVWILAWDVHALMTAPVALFDANIFHPAPRTLALSENLLGALPVYLPLALVWRDPVLAHQGTLLFTFAAAFLAMALLVHDCTGSWPAAVPAGRPLSVRAALP